MLATFGPESRLSPSASFAVRGPLLESPLGRRYMAEGDGHYDDSRLLQRAVDDLDDAGGGELGIEGGTTYAIGTTVTVPDGVHLVALGGGARLLAAPGLSGPLLRVATAATDVRLVGLRLSGGGGAGPLLVLGANSCNVGLERVSYEDYTGTPLALESGACDPYIRTDTGVWGEYNVLDFGAVGDGSTDDTAAFVNALAAASASAGRTVLAPATAGGYRLDGKLVVPPNVTLRGSATATPGYGGRRSLSSLGEAVTQARPSTVLIMGWASAGLDSDLSTDAWIQLGRGAALLGLTLSDPPQDADAAPTAKPWAIVCQGGGGSGNHGQAVENVYFDCVYRGLKIDRAAGVVVRELAGYPLYIGFQIDHVADFCDLVGVRFYPAASIAWGAGIGQPNTLDRWVLRYGTAVRIGRADGLSAHAIESFGYGTGIEFYQAADEQAIVGPPPVAPLPGPFGQITDLKIDGARVGMWVRAVALTGFQIHGASIWANHAAEAGATGQQAYEALPILYDLDVNYQTNGWLLIDGVSLKGTSVVDVPGRKAKSAALVRIPAPTVNPNQQGTLTLAHPLFYQWGTLSTDPAIWHSHPGVDLEVLDGRWFQSSGASLDVADLAASDTNFIVLRGRTYQSLPLTRVVFATTLFANTTLSTQVNAPGTVAVTVASAAGARVGMKLRFDTADAAVGATSIVTTGLFGLGWANGDALSIAGEGALTIVGAPVLNADGSYTVGLSGPLVATHAAGVAIANTTQGNAATFYSSQEDVVVAAVVGNVVTAAFTKPHPSGVVVRGTRKALTEEYALGDTMGPAVRRLSIRDTLNAGGGVVLSMVGDGPNRPSKTLSVTGNQFRVLSDDTSVSLLTVAEPVAPNVGVVSAAASVLRMRKEVTTYGANGALAVTDGVHAITKNGVAVMTLADPTTDQDGTVMEIFSETAQPHTVCNGAGCGGAGSGFNGLGAGADLATFGGAIGDGMRIVARGGKWYVLEKTNVGLA